MYFYLELSPDLDIHADVIHQTPYTYESCTPPFL